MQKTSTLMTRYLCDSKVHRSLDFCCFPVTPELLPRMACLPAATFIKSRSELSASEPTLFTKLATRGCCQNGEAELTSPEASLLFLQPVNFVKLPILVSNPRSHSTAPVTKHAHGSIPCSQVLRRTWRQFKT